MTFVERLERRIEDARVAMGISQEECGFRAGIHRTTISFYETGIRLPRLDSFVRLAGSVEVEPAELLGSIRWKPGVYEPGCFVDEDRS